MNTLDYQSPVPRAPEERPQPVVIPAAAEASLPLAPAVAAGGDNPLYSILGSSEADALVLWTDGLPAATEGAGLMGADPPQPLIAAFLVLADALRSEETFSQAMQARALKVVITAER